MRYLKIFFILVIISFLLVPGYTKNKKRIASLSNIQGTVEVKLQTDGLWVTAQQGMLLNEGDIIRTKANSQAVLTIGQDNQGEVDIIELTPDSQLLLSDLTQKDNNTSQTKLDLAIGKILIKAKKLRNEESNFKVKTPTSIVGVRGTVFSVDVEALE